MFFAKYACSNVFYAGQMYLRLFSNWTDYFTLFSNWMDYSQLELIEKKYIEKIVLVCTKYFHV